MSTDLTFVTNEPGNNLRDRFNTLLTDDTRFFDCLVGYFYISGFHKIYPALENVDKVRILVAKHGRCFYGFEVARLRLRQQVNHRLNQCVALLICLQHRIHPAGVTGRIMLGQFVRGDNLDSNGAAGDGFQSATAHVQLQSEREKDGNCYSAFEQSG